METVREISQWIRDYVNDPRHQQKLLSATLSWHRLCAAMDTIGDVDLALNAYTTGEFPEKDGDKYLKAYGVLQALFLQQDAFRYLIEILQPAIQVELPDVLKEIRDLRSASIGHPMDYSRKGQSSVQFINRSTLSKDGFQMLSFDQKHDTTFITVPVTELIEKQHKEAVRILSEVVEQLKEQDRAHKKQFRDAKLQGCFNLVLYAFEKISEDLSHSRIAMGPWAAGCLQTSLDDFESLMEKRGLDLDTYDSIKYLYDEIEYPLGQLRKLFNSEASDIPKPETVRVFADALQAYFLRLMDIAREIDEEYSVE